MYLETVLATVQLHVQYNLIVYSIVIYSVMLCCLFQTSTCRTSDYYNIWIFFSVSSVRNTMFVKVLAFKKTRIYKKNILISGRVCSQSTSVWQLKRPRASMYGHSCRYERTAARGLQRMVFLLLLENVKVSCNGWFSCN